MGCYILLVVVFCIVPLASTKEDKENTEFPAFTLDNDGFTSDLPAITLNNDNEEKVNHGEDKAGKSEEEMMDRTRSFIETNPTVVNGQPVFEGDMILTESQWRALRERKGLADVTKLWPDVNGFPLVPYNFNDNGVNKAAVASGIAHWEENTCITFQRTTNFSQPHLIFTRGSGCSSHIGIAFTNGQLVSIGFRCDTLGIVAHEIGHAIGFYHEQSRPDRDDYVAINEDNILSDRENNFNSYPTSEVNSQNVPYDYASLMHYGSFDFTNNGKTTIATKDRLAQSIIGQRVGLSHRDKQLANIMYGCINKWLAQCSMANDPCQNGGYTGANCACVCPPGTSGITCETTTGGYYDEYRDSCTEKVTVEGNITSPDYPNFIRQRSNCLKWIVAPECHVPEITFSDFRLDGKSFISEDNSICDFDVLEIRTDDLNNGDVFCGTDIAPGTTFTGTSQEMILYFKTLSFGVGLWSCELKFVPIPNCPTNTTTPTTNTTTPTTTTTTPTTTTTTPTTTTTTPTTTTTTPTTTTPAPPNLKCLIQLIKGIFYWSSPGFGITNYPDNFRCRVRGISSRSMVTIRVVFFKLEGRTSRTCVDAVKIFTLFDRTKTWCGTRRFSVFRSPSFNFEAEFFTNEVINREGFNISFTPATTRCHKIIRAAVGDSGRIWNPEGEKYCEYRIQAPPGSRVQVDKVKTRILQTSDCAKHFLLLNGNSEKMYPRASSNIYCGRNYIDPQITSSTRELYVAYQGRRRRRSFYLRYTIV